MKKFLLLISFMMPMVAMAFTTATTENVKANFAAHWTNNVYPRMYGSAEEVQRVKDLYEANDPLVVKAVNTLISEADAALTKPIPTWGLDDANLRVSSVHTIAKEFAPQLTIAYMLTGDEKYAVRAWQVVQTLYTYQDWGVQTESPWKDRHFLDTGIGAHNVAMLYDGLSGWMNEAQKDSLYQMSRKYVFLPAQKQYTGEAQRTWGWMYANNNWNGICNGGIISACLTMMEHEPDFLADIAARAINCLPNYINSFEPDGQSEEGLMYWSYGLMYTITAFDVMNRVLGTTYGYADTNGMQKTGYFPVFTSGPVVSLNIGDDPIKNSRANSMFWFSKYLNSPALARFQYDLLVENNTAMPWYDLFHYNPELVEQGGAVDVALDNYTRGIDVYTFIENWNSKEAMFLSVHGGSNTANHGHLDAGSFDIQAFGEVFANGNLGSDNYTYPGYFDYGDKDNNDCLPRYKDPNREPTSSQRWHFYRLRAEGKNCVVFNPDYRADQNPKQEAVSKNFFHSSDKVGSGAINLNMIYDRDVNTYTRGFRLDREHKMITIQDDIAAKSNKDIWWSMHTKASVTLSADKKTAILNLNGKSMKAYLRAPADGEFQVLSATYLDGRTFPLTRNSSNSNFRKLAVKLADTKNTLIRVEFTPADTLMADEIFDNFEGFCYKYELVNLSKVTTNVENPHKDEVNGSDLVMCHVRLPQAAEYAGVKTTSKPISVGMGAGQVRFMKVKLLKETLGDVQLKLENGTNGEVALYRPTQNPTKVGEWEEYTFDLFTDADGVSRQGTTFGLMFLMPDMSGVSEDSITTYIDDIRFTNVIDDNPDNVAFSQVQIEGVDYAERTSNSLRLKWNAAEGAVKYMVIADGVQMEELTDTTIVLNELESGRTYDFSVVAENVNGQTCVASLVLPVKPRLVNGHYELIDDAESLMEWEKEGEYVNLYSNQENTVKNIVNSSDYCLKFNRQAQSHGNAAMSCVRDLFQFDSSSFRYLHVKMYRGTQGGMAVRLANETDTLFVEKPLNEADTLKKAEWVDYVFDLTNDVQGKSYTSLAIFPDRTEKWSSSKNYFIDDVCLSSDARPFTSGFSWETALEEVKTDAVDMHYAHGSIFYLPVAGARNNMEIYDVTGHKVASDIYDAIGDEERAFMVALPSGIYIGKLSVGSRVYTGKLYVMQ